MSGQEQGGQDHARTGTSTGNMRRRSVLRRGCHRTVGRHSSCSRTRSRASASATTIPIVFPLEKRVTVLHDYLAPRTGHLHQGTDLMAAKMTKEMACVSGIVTLRVGTYAGVPGVLASGWPAMTATATSTSTSTTTRPAPTTAPEACQYAFAPGLTNRAARDSRASTSPTPETAGTPNRRDRTCTSRSTRPPRCPRPPWTRTTAWRTLRSMTAPAPRIPPPPATSRPTATSSTWATGYRSRRAAPPAARTSTPTPRPGPSSRSAGPSWTSSPPRAPPRARPRSTSTARDKGDDRLLQRHDAAQAEGLVHGDGRVRHPQGGAPLAGPEGHGRRHPHQHRRRGRHRDVGPGRASPRVEQTDSHFTYAGTWTTLADQLRTRAAAPPTRTARARR